jgi:hypothetical protein
MSPGEARRQAHLRLGGIAQVLEATRDARGVRWLDDVVSDIRYALRGFVRAPGFAVSAVLRRWPPPHSPGSPTNSRSASALVEVASPGRS